jgi:hypothetical protein
MAAIRPIKLRFLYFAALAAYDSIRYALSRFPQWI